MKVGKPWQIDPRRLVMRPYAATPEDQAALARVRNATMRPVTLPENFQEWPADEPSRYYERGGFALQDNAWLVLHEDTVVAAAIVYPSFLFHDRAPGNFDMFVIPEVAGHGLGTRLLAHLEQAAAARGHRVLETTIATEDAFSTKFLLSRGFRVVGHSMHLSRDSMSDLPEVKIPEGFALRSLADLQEEPELYRYTANRLGAYDPNYSLITPEVLEATLQARNWDPAGVLFLSDPNNRIVGVIRDSVEGARGSLHEIRLDPAWRGQGLGMLMVAGALNFLQRRGVSRAELDTAGENTAAHALALRAGFRVTRHWLHFMKKLHPGEATAC